MTRTMTRTPIIGRTLRLVVVSAVVIGIGAAGSRPAVAEVLYVASTSIQVFDAGSGNRLAEIPVGHLVFDIAFGRDGTRAYLATGAGVFEVDATKHTLLGRIIEGPAFDVAVSATGNLLHVLGNDVRKLADGQQEPLPSHLTVYDLTTRSVIHRQEVGERAQELALVAGVGAAAAVTRPRSYELEVVNVADGAVASLASFTGKTEGEEVPGFINGLAPSPDGKKLYLGQFGEQSSIHVVDPATGSSAALPFAHHGFITGVKTSADGRTLYVTTRNNLAIIDAATGAERAFIALGGAHMKMAISGDGRRSYHTLPTADENGGRVTVVDLAAGKVERTISTPGISAITIGVKP